MIAALRRRFQRRALLCAIIGVISAASVAEPLAQEAASRSLTVPKLGGYAEIAVINRYVYRGYVVADHGPVVQPYVELYGEFYGSENGWLTSASLKLSLFNSFQVTDGDGREQAEVMRVWYESQLEAGFEFILAQQLTASATYLRFESPNGIYGTSNALKFALRLDDEPWLGAFALHPHASWIAPLNRNPDEGNYFAVGLAPRVKLAPRSRYPVTATLLTNAGFGDHDQYVGGHFGFVSAGVRVSAPLAFIPEAYGKWQIGGSAEAFYLGEAGAEFTNNGDHVTSVFGASIGAEF
jgi:hypothetical protein